MAHPESERALALLDAVAAGCKESALEMAGLLARAVPGRGSTAALAVLLHWRAAGGVVTAEDAGVVLAMLREHGVVPEAVCLDNVPSALARRGGGSRVTPAASPRASSRSP